MTETAPAAPSPAQPRRTPRRRGEARSLLLASGFAALVAAWLMGNPLTATPDEPTHFVKAVGTAYRQWTVPPLEPPRPGLTQREEAIRRLSGLFRMPPRLALPERLVCVAFHPERSAACQRVGPATAAPTGGRYFSQVAPYQPFLYVPMGLAARAAGNGQDGLRLARVTGAAICVVLLVGAARCCRSPATAWGLLLAATPVTLFLSASVTTSGTELTGAICLAAAGLALARGRSDGETWLWWALGGAVLALSRPLGPVWVGFHVLVLLTLVGWRPAARLVRARPRWSGPALVVVAAASVSSLAWQRLVMPALPLSLGQARPFLGPAVRDLPAFVDKAVGLFGWYDTALPRGLYVLGRALLGAALVAALVAGTRRERLVLGASLFAAAATTVALDAGTQRPLGFVMQARYSLPVAVVVPLLCGHVLERRGRRFPALIAGLVRLGVVGAAVLHGGAWYFNARRYAVGGSGRPLFLLSPDWSPPGGWWPWALAAAAGAALLCAGGLLDGSVTRGRARPGDGTRAWPRRRLPPVPAGGGPAQPA